MGLISLKFALIVGLFIVVGVKAFNPSEDGLFSERLGDLKEADIGEFPWAVNIFYRGQHICGGSIVDKKHIITGAACLMSNGKAAHFTILAGDRLNNSREDGDVSYEVAELIRHELFKEMKSETVNDIGIIKLRKPINFRYSKGRKGSIKPIDLPKLKDNFDVDDILEVSGYRSGYSSLMKQSVKLISCGSMVNSNSALCTIDSAEFDRRVGLRGSGLIKSINGKRNVLAGIVSSRGLNVYQYTKVFKYRDWIKKHTN